MVSSRGSEYDTEIEPPTVWDIQPESTIVLGHIPGRWLESLPSLAAVVVSGSALSSISAVVEAAQSAAVVVSGSVGREDAVSHDPAARAGDRALCLGELISPPLKARAGLPDT